MENEEKNDVGTESGEQSNNTLRAVAFAFAIVGTVFLGVYLIPLAWCIPMTIEIYHHYKEGKELSVAFKVCTLLFVSVVSGILLLVDSD